MEKIKELLNQNKIAEAIEQLNTYIDGDGLEKEDYYEYPNSKHRGYARYQ